MLSPCEILISTPSTEITPSELACQAEASLAPKICWFSAQKVLFPALSLIKYLYEL